MQQVAIRAATAIMMNTISTTGTTHTYTGIDSPAETQSGMYACGYGKSTACKNVIAMGLQYRYNCYALVQIASHAVF